MSIYLGNTFIGNGNYLGNQNITDNNIFIPPLKPCYISNLVYFTSDDNINFRFGFTQCDGNQATISGGTATPGRVVLGAFTGCLRPGEIIGLSGTTVLSVTGSNQCGTFI